MPTQPKRILSTIRGYVLNAGALIGYHHIRFQLFAVVEKHHALFVLNVNKGSYAEENNEKGGDANKMNYGLLAPLEVGDFLMGMIVD